MEQKALIARVQVGDRSAFTDLTSRYRDMAFGYALALLRDFHVAQDVTQEAFLTAYLNLAVSSNVACAMRKGGAAELTGEIGLASRLMFSRSATVPPNNCVTTA